MGDTDLRNLPLVDLAAVDAAVLTGLVDGPVVGRAVGCTDLRSGMVVEGALIFPGQVASHRLYPLVFCRPDQLRALERLMGGPPLAPGLVCVCDPDGRRWGPLGHLPVTPQTLWGPQSIVNQVADLLWHATANGARAMVGSSLFETLRAYCCPQLPVLANELQVGFARLRRGANLSPDELTVCDHLSRELICAARLAEEVTVAEQPIYQALRQASCPVDRAVSSARLLAS